MINTIRQLGESIRRGHLIDRVDAMKLINISSDDSDTLHVLFEEANLIRKTFVGHKADLCTIKNVKSGKCSEDCKFCAQSSHFTTEIESYNMLSYEEILDSAKEVEAFGGHRFSLVSSGRGPTNLEMPVLCDIYSRLKKDTNLLLCASHGLLTYEQACLLKESGVDRYHHNLEASQHYYESICSTHDYADRISTVENVVRAGLDICSGGILGIGETREDRVTLAFALRELDVQSIPINILTPIKGTPFQDIEKLPPMEILKTISIFKFINPTAHIRYAGGRMALEAYQALGFNAGISAALTGNYLTTSGSHIDADKTMLSDAGFTY